MNISGLGDVTGFFAVLLIGVTVLMHILFTVCIWNDASRLRQQGRATVVLTPFVWGLTALFMGLVAVAFYWLCHYSRFGRRDTTV